MTLHNNPVRRVLVVRKQDGHLAIGMTGEQSERREFPRVPGAFKVAQDKAWSVIRQSNQNSEAK